jgi:phospholipid transport system substrate-binding protein
MRMKRIISVLMFSAIFALNIAASDAGQSPIVAMQSTIDSVLEIMRDKSLSVPDKKEERRARISAQLRERFHFKEMSKRSLAKHWKKRTPEEKAEFVKIFSDLLEASYISKIEAYTDEKITYDKETIKSKGKYSVVKTTIVTKTVEIPIDYKLITKKEKWWVYDVIIEGVSFVSTYRSQYNRIIKKESFAALIDSMKNKLKELNKDEVKAAS